MDQCGSSLSISSKVLIKDELDIECEDYDNGYEESEEINIKQESYSSMSIPDVEYYNSDTKDEDDFVIDDYEKRCCVWLKENPTPLLLQEPDLPILTLPEGTEIIKVEPVKYKKPKRLHKNNEEFNVTTRPADLIKREKKETKDEFEAIKVLWTSKLQRLENTQRVLAEDLVNQILKKGFFKELATNTTLFDS